MKLKWCEWKEKIAAVFVIFCFYGGMQFLGITCPIKYVMGISCAGCGMTRAWLALLRGNISGAFYYHPLFFLPPVAVIIFLLKARLNKKIYQYMIAAVIALFLGVYFYRMYAGSGDIVVFEPQQGLIARIFRWVTDKSTSVFSKSTSPSF